MAKQSNLREKFDNLAAAEALEGAGPKGLDESLARLSVVKLELERFDRALKDQEATVSRLENEKALLEERMVREDDSELWEKEAKERDARTIWGPRSLGKQTIRSLGEDYGHALANRSKWRKTARAEDSRRLRKVIPLLIHHVERLDRLAQEHRRWAKERNELEQLIETAQPSSSLQNMRDAIAADVEKIREEAISCIEKNQHEDFDKWFTKTGLNPGQGFSGRVAAANWKKIRLSSGNYRELFGTPEILADNEDTNTVLGAYRLFIQLKKDL